MKVVEVGRKRGPRGSCGYTLTPNARYTSSTARCNGCEVAVPVAAFRAEREAAEWFYVHLRGDVHRAWEAEQAEATRETSPPRSDDCEPTRDTSGIA